MRSGVVCLLFSALARAEESTPEPLFSYRAPVSCPSSETFLAELERRNPSHVARLNESDWSVVIEPIGGGFVGHLERGPARAKDRVREVTGDDCSDVAKALGLLLTLALDAPESFTAPTKRAGGETEKPTESPTAATTARPPPADPPTRIERDSPTHRKGEPTGRGGGVGISVEFLTSIAPEPLVGPGLFAALWLGSWGPLSLGPRLSVTYATGSFEQNQLGAQVRLFAARGDLCLRVTTDRLFVAAEPCLGVLFGRLEAKGTGDRLALLTDVGPWFELGPTLRISTTRRVGRIFLDGSVGLAIPATHYEYRFADPSATLYVSDRPGLRLSLGAGVGWP